MTLFNRRHESLCLLTYVCILGLVLPCTVFAQPAPDSTLSPPFRAAVDSFLHKMVSETHVFDGPEYLPNRQTINGHAYFESDMPRAGSLQYEGIVYNDIFLLYDIYVGALIVQTDRKYQITLPVERIGGFSIGGHRFVNIVPDSAATGFPGKGLYELLYSGREELLARHRKTVQVTVATGESYFREETTYYLKRGNRYDRISTQKSLFRLLNIHNGELRQISNKLKFSVRQDTGLGLAVLLSYYDQLTTAP